MSKKPIKENKTKHMKWIRNNKMKNKNERQLRMKIICFDITQHQYTVTISDYQWLLLRVVFLILYFIQQCDGSDDMGEEWGWGWGWMTYEIMGWQVRRERREEMRRELIILF